jgi:nickel-dependent lactate racemase
VDAVAREALAHPVAGPRLRELARPGMKVTVVIPDATRPSPDATLLPLLLEELAAGGVAPGDVTVLLALGMHRVPTPDELTTKLGTLRDRLRVESSQGADRSAFVESAAIQLEGLPPVPITLHRRAVECDLLVSTGWVEPHQYAGFSGGGKTVAVGCGGEATLEVLHGLSFLDHPGTGLARLAGNPFQEVIRQAAARSRLAFVLNTAAPGGNFRAAAGPPQDVLLHLAADGGGEWQVDVGPEPFDVVFTGLDPTKARNLYQASRALTYLAFAPRPVVRRGGWIVMVAACEEGFGTGPGEAAFREALRGGTTPDAVLSLLRGTGVAAGGQRAYMVARALAERRGLVAGVDEPARLEGSLFTVVPDARSTLEFLERTLGDRARVLVVPDALNMLPVLTTP